MENKMSLKLLNPGLRPLGTFDCRDADTLTGGLEGGEYVELQSDDADDGYAADAGTVGPMDPGTGGGLIAPELLNFAASSRTATNLGGLADEGTDGYGTLFGSMIGSTAGQATSVSGSVVIGPSTAAGSGKVTVWAQSGLYGVNGAASDDATAPLTAAAAVANAPVYADTSGLLTTTDTNSNLAIYVGRVADSSLVSTTNAAVGLAAAVEYHAIWYLGNAARDQIDTDDS